MDVVDQHGTLQVHVAPARALGTLSTLAMMVAVASPLLMLVDVARLDRALLEVLTGLALAAAVCLLVLRRLTREETLQIGLFVRTGFENDVLMVRSSDLLAVGKEERPPLRTRAALRAACGAGAGRLRLHTTHGDFLFGAGLSEDDLTRLVWRLTPICRHNLRPRGHASHHFHK